ASALDKFKAGPYDLVLMDIQMPILDGYSTVRLMREWEETHQKRRTPIVALTAHTLDEEVKAAQQAGCDLHLSKPLRKTTLLRTIDMILRSCC
ncbi:MAG: response regulator, partial [Deltaproteobacteria bacterium]|nr:response regulator [Deltaproteobacteria bacterium]